MGGCLMRRSLMLLLLVIAAGCGVKAAKDDPTGGAPATGRLVPMMGAVAVDPGGGTVRVAVLRSMGPSPEELSHPSVDADDVAGGKLLLKDAGMEDAGEHL